MTFPLEMRYLRLGN